MNTRILGPSALWLAAASLLAGCQPKAKPDPAPAQTAQTGPSSETPPAAQPNKPGTPPATTSARAAAAASSERPLDALPYTPVLDLEAMDRSVDPCVDFYKYSCGGWIRKNPIPPDQASWSVYAKLYNENVRFLWGVLAQAAKPRPDRSPVEQKIGDYFGACMDEAAIEQRGAAPLQARLDEIARLGALAELPALLGRLHLSTGSDILFDLDAEQDFDNSERVIAFASAGGLGLPDRDYYVKTDAKSEETRERYRAHIAEMLVLAGESAADARAHAERVLAIETALARASLTRVERRDPYKLRHRMTVAALQKLTPAFSWARYLDAAGLKNITQLNVTEPAFFRQVEVELGRVPLDDWKTYLRWHVTSAMAPYLSSPFVQANFGFYRKYLRGVEAMTPRWKRCVNWVDRDLGEALGQVFVAKAFGPEIKQRTLAMVVEIEKTMEAEIQSLPWMSPTTKKKALEKLHSMVNKIGYPDRWRDYSALEIRPGDFAGNVERAILFETRRELGKIGKPLDRGEWGMTPPTVNAYYNPQVNDMNFPAGVLLPPLFDPRLDDAPNYGNTGSTIGHELIHGFDDEGRQYDARGNLRDWWTPADAKEFERRAQCIVDQYAGYTIIDDIKINSKLTLGEDVADLGGTLIAYKAWRNATQAQRLGEVDGLSPDQRFFIGFAQWDCASERPESKRLNAVTNPHSPAEYRINGVVANMVEFREAFQCKPGQPMVHEPACSIW